MAEEITETRAFETVEHLLEVLHPRRAEWQPRPDRWVFRGHGDARWRLYPTAHRSEAWVRFRWPDRRPHDPFAGDQSAIVQGQAEAEILRRFFEGLDDAGLAIPGDEHIRVETWDAYQDSTEPFPPGFDPFLALARHSGIPTRLLDWSRQAKFALYFAADAAARLLAVPDRRPELLEIWALRIDFVERHRHNYPRLGLHVVRVPQATNPNLNAQSGLCTTWSGDPGRLAPFDEISARVHAEEPARSPELPLFRRFTLPASEAPRSLRLLAYEGVTGARMFPGHAGVVRSLDEQAFWDEPHAGRRY